MKKIKLGIIFDQPIYSGGGFQQSLNAALIAKQLPADMVDANFYTTIKKNIKNKLTFKHSKYLKDILNEIFFDLKDKKLKKNIIFFSPAGASFDSFKNFEDRGKYFNQLIKKFLNAKQ